MTISASDQRKRYNIITGAPNVRAAGGVLLGNPLVSTDSYPQDASTPLAPELGLDPAGHISEEGVTKTVDRSTEKIKDWNGDTVMVLESDHSVTLKLTFLEGANVSILKTVYGTGNVKVRDGGRTIEIAENAEALENLSMAFEIKGGNGARIRVLAPDVKVTSVGDVQWVKSGVVKYEVTVECFPDAEGNKLYQWIDRKVFDVDGVTRTVTLPEGASGGKWNLTVDGVLVEGLAHNIKATALKGKLDAAGLTGVEVSGDGPFVLVGVTDVSVDAAGLTGGSGSATVTHGDGSRG